MKPSYTLQLSDSSARVESVGGKGLSLAKMANAGLPVPGGFHITTAAYWDFVRLHGLQEKILATVGQADPSLPASLETASARIQALFLEAEIPPDLAGAIRGAYQALAGNPPHVAVRSSATAEDLPGASFAGQQETFLNVSGSEALLDAVKRCWSSLWTGRAISYRLKNHIDQDVVSMAVIVQELIDAQSAGVLFTANPINGRRDEMLINAAWGLGETIVGGLVTPDTLIIEKPTGRIKKQEIAKKNVITILTDTGTQEITLKDSRRNARVLNAADTLVLAEFGRRIETFYGVPQDIEWCPLDGRFFILQSRPITALRDPELPAPVHWKLPQGAYALVRNNIVELMAGPLSPLFATLGLAAVNRSLHRVMNESFDMRDIMPPEIIVVVNHYAYNNGSISLKSLVRVTFGARRLLRKMFTGAVERWTEIGRSRYREAVEDWQLRNWRSCSSTELVEAAGQLTEASIDAYAAMISGLIPAAWITEALFTFLYDRLVKRRGDPPASAFLLGYESMPLRADQSLFRLAKWAQDREPLASFLAGAATSNLVAAVSENAGSPPYVPPAMWKEWRRLFHDHLHYFGHTLYDLDFAHSVPADDPAPLLETFKLYLSGQAVDPQARRKIFEQRREALVIKTRQRLSGWKLKWFDEYLSLAQRYAPLREDALAEIGLAYPLLRQVLRELGRRFSQQQIIPSVEDIFWLTREEVLLVAGRLDAGLPTPSLTDNIPMRKAEHQAALGVSPPMALPQLKIFGFDLMSLRTRSGRGAQGSVIKGVAASPGSATGIARILRGPGDFGRLQPGDVLVAPITTPAWTPLFTMAAAIVTDVGGPLSHGSIVAREYGIPAVLGTRFATHRIQDGQKVTVDGTAGTVTLILIET